MTIAQVADLLFGADAHPHDYLHEVLFRLLAVGWIGAATQNLVNKVCMTVIFFCFCAYGPTLGHGINSVVFVYAQLLNTMHHYLLL